MQKNHILLSFLFASITSVFQLAWATEGTFTNIHQQYSSTRVNGMGGAFAAIANDESAIFYNPAGLARINDGKIQTSLIDASVSSNFFDFNTQLQKNSGSGATGVASLAAMLNTFYGNQYNVRLKFFETNWIRPGWGVSFIPADVTIDMAVQKQGAPALDIRMYADTTLAYSFARNIHNVSLGLLSWGVTAKAILREYTNKELNALDIATSSTTISNTDIYDGITGDLDFGMLYNPYLPDSESWDWVRSMRPTFAFVGRNLIDSGFSARVLKISTVQTGQPEKLYRAFDIGTRLEIPKFWIFGGRFALDERDIMHPNFNAKRGMHMGFEFDWTVTNWWKGQWRVGYGQNFWSAGFSALFTAFRLDLATYGEDVGSFDTPKENRILQLKASGEF